MKYGMNLFLWADDMHDGMILTALRCRFLTLTWINGGHGPNAWTISVLKGQR